MKQLLTIAFFFTLYSCLTNTKQVEPLVDIEPKEYFYDTIEQHFYNIDSFRKIDPDLMEAENIKLQHTINRYKAEIFNLNDTSGHEFLYIVKSTDKKLSLISWDTRMGGTMIDFATMAIYKTSGGDIISKLLFDTTDSPIGNTLMHYDKLYTIEENSKTVYIAHGFGQGSTALPWQELRAFQINDRQLISPKIFPEHKPNFFIEFDTHKLKGNKVPVILVTDSGRAISSPIPNEDGGFPVKYQKLVFSNGAYKAAHKH